MSVLSGSFVAKVGEIITRYSMLNPGERIGVAVSGGADSVSLLHVMHRLRAEFAIELSVLHVNHQLRGAESEGDEAFVTELAASLGHRAFVHRERPNAGNLEQEARDIRSRFFRAAIASENLSHVALGHTLDDQAETVLFRILRGTGATGLTGMRLSTSQGFIRPLLPISRSEVRAWAEQAHIAWREDSSNDDPRFTRNRIRKHLLPLLERDYRPHIRHVLAGAAQVAQDEENFWNQYIEPKYHAAVRQGRLGLMFSVHDLKTHEPAVLRRLIRRALGDLRGDLRSLDRAHIEAICRLCESEHGHDRVAVPGVDAIRSFGALLIAEPGKLKEQPRGYEFPVNFGEEIALPGQGGILRVDRILPKMRICANFKEVQEVSPEISILSGERIAELSHPVRLRVRNWEPGDSMVREGHRSTEKVKTLFQEHKTFLWERRHWPVLVANDRIVWVRQFGISDPFAATESDTNRLRISFWPAKPD